MCLLHPSPLVLALGVALFAPVVLAQQPAATSSSDSTALHPVTLRQKPTTLQSIVVTASPIAIKQLDASYSIVSVGRAQIQDTSPFSVADLLNLSPGIWAESSTGGGNAGKVFLPGYVMSMGSPFLTTMVNGTPLFGMPQVSFVTNLQLMRMDDTVQRVEIVQGGPSAIFGPGQMVATANFVLRRGTRKPSGDIALTYGSEGMKRLDGFYGFQLAPGWLASVGGFYRVSNGVRNAQFPADKGGQITATLSHSWHHGSLFLWGRVLNDENLFYNQYPMIQLPDGKYGSYPGFDPLTATYYSRAIQHVMLPSPEGGLINANLDDGRGASARFFGGTYNQALGHLKITDRFGYTDANVPTEGLFPKNNPTPLSFYLYGCHVTEPTGWCTNGKPFDSNNLNYPASRVVKATLLDGQTVPLGTSVIQQGWNSNSAHLKNFVNDLRFNYQVVPGNTLTAGLYLDRTTLHAATSLGNQMLMLNQPNTQPIALSYTADGQTFIQSNADGFVDMNRNNDTLQTGTGWQRAIYLSDTWGIGRWLLQAGARVENDDIRERSCNVTGQTRALYPNA